MTPTELKIKKRDDILKKIVERENELHFLNTQIRSRQVEIDLITQLINQLKKNYNEIV